MSETHVAPKPIAMNVEERLLRASALAALVENVAAVLPYNGAHDFSSDPEFFEGLAAVAGLIREDMAAARTALDFAANQRVAPDVR